MGRITLEHEPCGQVVVASEDIKIINFTPGEEPPEGAYEFPCNVCGMLAVKRTYPDVLYILKAAQCPESTTAFASIN